MRKRERNARRIAAAIAVLVVWVGPATDAAGQSEPGSGTSTSPYAAPSAPSILRLRSEPSGAFVRLDGEYIWKGTTPLDLTRGISGNYEVTAEMKGYERWRRTIVLNNGESRDLSIQLTRKTPLKAVWRSALVPGWGQHYSDQRKKGTIITVGTLFLEGLVLWAHRDYRSRVDDAREAERAYFGETQLDELPAARARYESAVRKADRAYSQRRAFLVTSAVLYMANIVDAAISFPPPSRGGLTAVEPWGDRGPRLALGSSDGSDVRVSINLGLSRRPAAEGEGVGR